MTDTTPAAEIAIAQRPLSETFSFLFKSSIIILVIAVIVAPIAAIVLGCVSQKWEVAIFALLTCLFMGPFVAIIGFLASAPITLYMYFWGSPGRVWLRGHRLFADRGPLNSGIDVLSIVPSWKHLTLAKQVVSRVLEIDVRIDQPDKVVLSDYYYEQESLERLACGILEAKNVTISLDD